MEDTLKRVIENMQVSHIGKYNPNANWSGVGDLEKSIHATIVKSANGDMALVTFFYNHYGSYVELAVQKNLKYIALPEAEDKFPISRPDGANRKAKPFLHSQIRRKTKQTLTELGKLYTYHGAAAYWQAVDNPEDKTIHAMNEQSLEELASNLGLN